MMKLIIGAVVGFVLLTISLITIGLSETIVKRAIINNTQLVENTFLYENWLKPPVDVYTSFYLFNLINADEFEQNGAKPVLEEIGPFIYKETRIKENVTDNKNGTITYIERRLFHFEPNMTNISRDTLITSINMPALTIINYLKDHPYLEPIVAVAFRLFGVRLVIKQPAEKLLFGYEDKFLAYLHSLNKEFPSAETSLFLNKNNTITGIYTIFNGVDDPFKLGVIQYFNGMNNLSYWSSDYANQINGTDSSLNYPFLNKSSTPFTFQPDICRSTYTVYNETITTLNGITTFGYVLDENFFANVSINPDNLGFCTPPSNCLISGVLNVTNCIKIGNIHVPIYISNPHYLFGDEKLINDLVGLKPNFNKHKAVIYFEPLTGIPMKGNKRSQINAKLVKNSYYSITRKLPDIYFPLFWIDEHFEIDKKSADLFYKRVTLPLLLLDLFKYLSLTIGSIATFLCLLAIFYKKNKTIPGYTEIGVDENESLISKLSSKAENFISKNEQESNQNEKTSLLAENIENAKEN